MQRRSVMPATLDIAVCMELHTARVHQAKLLHLMQAPAVLFTREDYRPGAHAPPVVMMHLRNSRLMTMALSRTSSAGGELLGCASSSRRSRGCSVRAVAAFRHDTW